MPGALSTAHNALHDLLNMQMLDPDNGDDPVDEGITGHIKNAIDHITKAQILQGKDGTPDATPPGVLGGPQGDQNTPSADGSAASGGAGDMTGSRSDEQAPRITQRELRHELELIELERLSRRKAS
jgi:hypothetical protein